jgi:hypothetical protein
MDDQHAQTGKPAMEGTEADLAQATAHKPVAAASGEPQAPRALTPEEQMALYEKELKENDWGHQPC